MSMLSVPVVGVVCFLSGLKNIGLKCLHSADYFSVFLCHRNSSALAGKTALVLSAETCFYNQQGSCVVLAGLCGGKVWGGHGERLWRALARQCRGRRWGRVSPRMFRAWSLVSHGKSGIWGSACPVGCSEPAPDLKQHLQRSPKLLSLSQITLLGDSIFPSGGNESVGGRGCHNRDCGKLRQL